MPRQLSTAQPASPPSALPPRLLAAACRGRVLFKGFRSCAHGGGALRRFGVCGSLSGWVSCAAGFDSLTRCGAHLSVCATQPRLKGGGGIEASAWAAAATAATLCIPRLKPALLGAAPLPLLCSCLPCPARPRAAARMVLKRRSTAASTKSQKGGGRAATCPRPGPRSAPRHLLLRLPPLLLVVCSLLLQLCLDNMEPRTSMVVSESARRLNACVGATPALARAFAAWLESEDEVGGGRRRGGGEGVERLWGHGTVCDKTRGPPVSVLVSHAHTKHRRLPFWGT
jgi:hypothetical protein